GLTRPDEGGAYFGAGRSLQMTGLMCRDRSAANRCAAASSASYSARHWGGMFSRKYAAVITVPVAPLLAPWPTSTTSPRKQVDQEASGCEDQVVTEVELVDVNRDARDGWHDRSPHRRVGDHAVALAGALARDRHDGRGQVAEQLVGLVRPHPEPPGREVGG